MVVASEYMVCFLYQYLLSGPDTPLQKIWHALHELILICTLANNETLPGQEPWLLGVWEQGAHRLPYLPPFSDGDLLPLCIGSGLSHQSHHHLLLFCYILSHHSNQTLDLPQQCTPLLDVCTIQIEVRIFSVNYESTLILYNCCHMWTRSKQGFPFLRVCVNFSNQKG